MNRNSFGNHFVIHSFGESHGPAMGVVVEGCPAGLEFDNSLVQYNLNRRRPGQSAIVSQRVEDLEFTVLSGLHQGKTLGTPIAMVVENTGFNLGDYNEIEQALARGEVLRPGHADDLWRDKYGHSDVRGGGRASGRETVSRVLGGSVAQMLVKELSPETQVCAFTQSIHEIAVEQAEVDEYLQGNFDLESSVVRMPSKSKTEQIQRMLVAAKHEGQSFGGVAKVVIKAPPKGLGQPVFGKLKSQLSSGLMSIGAVVGVEIGAGFSATKLEGGQFHGSDTSAYGGVRGGLSTGENIELQVAIKPTSSIQDVAKRGRHDPCIVPRAVIVVEAMVNLVLADLLMGKRLDQI